MPGKPGPTLPPCVACRIVSSRKRACCQGRSRGRKYDAGILSLAGMDRRRARAFRVRRCGRTGAGQLSRPPREDHRPDWPRWQLRSGRAAPRRRAFEAHRPSLLCREKPGAGTVVGTQVAAQSEPDGYTLLVGGLSNMAFNPALYSKLPYDPLRDFVPVALVYRFGYVMVGRRDMPQTKLQDIIAAAKANPGSITVATAGVGTGQQLVAAAFMKAAGVKLLEVPYKGSPPAFTDLLAGRIDLFFDSIAAGLPYVQSGAGGGACRVSSPTAPLWRLIS